MLLTDVPRQARGVAGRTVDDEAVLIHPEQGKVRVLNSVGARLWELADGERTIAEMAAVIAGEYEVSLAQAESDALKFCTDLIGRTLLALDS
jgi:hypothetical protein